jgi:hypothetical protein
MILGWFLSAAVSLPISFATFIKKSLKHSATMF